MRTKPHPNKIMVTNNIGAESSSFQRKTKPKEKNPEFVKFGRYIQAHRKAQKLSQAQLAARLGITTKSVSYYECGFSFPKPQHLFALAKILNLSLDQYAEISCQTQPSHITEIASNKYLFVPTEFGAFLETLSAEEKRHILSILEVACDTLPSNGK